MGKLLSVLASAKIFLLSLWAQSLVLNHNQEKNNSVLKILVMLCFQMKPYAHLLMVCQ